MIDNVVFPYDSRSKNGAEIELYCLPSAGGNAAMYSTWNQLTPDWLNVCPVEYPGHGSRLKEPLTNNPHRLIHEITEAIINKGKSKIALFGHSVGSILALQVVKQLQLGDRAAAIQLIVLSGRPETSMLSNRPRNYHLLPREAFLKVVAVYEGIPEELVDNQEVLDFFLPILRNDFQLNDRLIDIAPVSTTSPLMAMFGQDDTEIVSAEAVEKWSTYTTRWLGSHIFPGGHFYLNDKAARSALLAKIVDASQTVMAGSR
ncbi:thioesterase [Brenneria goodwinii]|uniref:thioesterase II family protein n=1 Tax=Brenneria goodwinii TaxID=1109412 RepID=UPI000EF19022|nr:alpha/beta fold hydrolase [Brenneria goodwinii]MCG8157286.1 thioesterase [Brenneria goodwinii]MCG8162240.1 thioesterase [Brenneria goodwinii]MCG8166170.1 thioesterase [Brenneria goodwinii]MCG8170797.1 thioesterase [Brenneria goodwinii]MCG8175867.1 thioesterase [Brenneria goodwinii]